MIQNSLKMRCFHVGCGHEIVLPNGKTILIDPYYPEKTPGHTQEDIQGADYVLVTHTHFDHDTNLRYIVQKFNSMVILPASAAFEEARATQLPYDCFYPVFPHSTYTFPDFKLEVFQAKHNSLGPLHYAPDIDIPLKETGEKGFMDCFALGSLFSLDYLITTNNGFRILIASGQNIWEETLTQYNIDRPNMLLRQCSVRPKGVDLFTGGQVDAKTLAALFVKYHAQVLIPFHSDVLRKKMDEETLKKYFDDVAAEVARLDPGAAFFVPEAWKWYQFGITAQPCE